MTEGSATEAVPDPEFPVLAELSVKLQGRFTNPAVDPWESSPFGWITHIASSSVRGRIGAELFSAWCADKGLSVGPTGDSQADRLINGKRIEIKFSTRWASGIYKFQQLRDQRYDYAAMLGISPLQVHCWVVPKEILMTRPYLPGMGGQHGGSAARDTAWLTLKPESPPIWLASYGGRLEDAAKLLRRT